MCLFELIYLLSVGVAGGIITSIVGGASLVTYPALLATGLAPVTAVIVNLVALMPANLGAAWLDRRQLPAIGPPFWLMLAVAGVGAMFGAGLLLLTSDKVFSALVPILLAISTVLFAYAGPIATWIDGGTRTAAEAESNRWVATIVAMVPVSIYGGYFGAGASVMLLAILMVVARGDYRVANAVKNLVSGLTCLVATLVYAVQDRVVWRPAIIVTLGALVGALIGVRIVRFVSREVMRRAVIGTGVVVTIVFAMKYWL